LERLGTVAIIGVGLIGGSVGLALRERGLARRVVGIGRDEARLAQAHRLGAVDEATTDLARGVAGAEVVIVGTPVHRIAAAVIAAAGSLSDGGWITDTGTKREIVAAVAQQNRARGLFVGAHPIAGSERQGAAHARADLFEGQTCVLTPTAATPARLVDRARAFWEALGSRVRTMTPEAHDAALARTSHLPHAVAAALAATVPPECLPLAAGAYRDGTRVAAAAGALWTAIFQQNRHALLDALTTFEDHMAQFRRALEADDPDQLLAWWESARTRRAAYDAQHGPDADRNHDQPAAKDDRKFPF
jgi:prephenate dehydrogenase